jgi:hypothetical protein
MIRERTQEKQSFLEGYETALAESAKSTTAAKAILDILRITLRLV